MNEALAEVIRDPEAESALRQFFDAGSLYVVHATDDVELSNRELQDRWSTQPILDQVMSALGREDDAEAMRLLQSLSVTATVELGILAKMMECHRAPLNAFVVDRFNAEPGLRHARFNGRSALHHAAGAACLDATRVLLNLGADANQLDEMGHPPLHRACATKHPDCGLLVVRELLSHGAHVNAASGNSQTTALHQAARFGHASIVLELLAHGADPAAMDRNGVTPLDRARNCRRFDVVAILEHLNPGTTLEK